MTDLGQQRADLAATVTFTLSNSATVTGSPSAPDVVAVFDAWPVWDSSTWSNRCVQSHTWRVYVALPNGATDGTNDAADLVLNEVGEQLWTLGHVDRAAPAVWATDGMQGYPCVEFTITI